jgi:hypothetical protein
MQGCWGLLIYAGQKQQIDGSGVSLGANTMALSVFGGMTLLRNIFVLSFLYHVIFQTSSPLFRRRVPIKRWQSFGVPTEPHGNDILLLNKEQHPQKVEIFKKQSLAVELWESFLCNAKSMKAVPVSESKIC